MRLYLFSCLVFLVSTASAQHDLHQPNRKFLPHTSERDVQVSDRNGPQDCLPDSVLRYSYTSLTDSVLVGKTIWQYNGSNAVTRHRYDDTPLKIRNIDSMTYDAQGRLVLQESWQFNDPDPIVYNTRVLLYPHGNTTAYDSIIFYGHNAAGTAELNDKFTYWYDANDRLTLAHSSSWNSSDNTWNDLVRSTYSYTLTGKINQDQRDRWDGVNWAPDNTVVYTYDLNDSLLQELVIDLVDNIPLYKNEYSYDPAEHETLVTLYEWNVPAQDWVQSYHYRQDRDPQGRDEQTEIVNFAGDFFANRIDYFYGAGNNDCLWFTSEYASGDGQSWALTFRDYYFYNGSVAVQDAARLAEKWSAYPNPAAGWLWLEAPAGSPVRLVDFSGRTLYTGIAEGLERIDLRGAQGVCMLVVGEGKTATSRLIMVGK